MKHMKKKPNSQKECGFRERGGIIVCGRWTRSARPRGLGGDFEFLPLESPRNPITPIETSRVVTLHPGLYKNLREGARRVIGATAKPLYPIDGKAVGLDRRSPRPPSSRDGDRPVGGGRSYQAVEGVRSRSPSLIIMHTLRGGQSQNPSFFLRFTGRFDVKFVDVSYLYSGFCAQGLRQRNFRFFVNIYA